MNRKLALLAVFLVQLLYGINYTVAKHVINDGYVKPYGFVLLRVVGATFLFWLLSLFLPKEKINPKDYLLFLAAAFFGVATNMLLFFKGLELTTPIHASVIVTTTPIIILICSALFLKEAITKQKLIGVVLGFIGAVILTVYGKSIRAEDNVLLGNIFVFINAVSYSIYIIIIKRLTYKYHPVTFIKWLFLFGLFLVLPFGYNDVAEIQWQTFTPYITFSVIFVVVGATFATYLLNPLALTKLKASTVGSFIYLQPVIAGVFAILMKVDTLNVIKLLAMAFIFAGVYLVSLNPKSKTV